MKHLKVVVCGDESANKTEYLIVSTTNAFPGEYIPTTFDNYSFNWMSDGLPPVNIQLWDTASQDDYKKLRPLSYPQTDVFLFMFSLVDPLGLERIESVWVPEVEEFCPGKPCILVGTQSEKRDSFPNFEQKEPSMEPIPPSEGERIARRIHAYKYVEVSSAKYKNIDVLNDAIVSAYFKVEKN